MSNMAPEHSKSSVDVSRLDKQIDENLRRVFESTASEPLPERFTNLLEQLKSQGGQTTHDK